MPDLFKAKFKTHFAQVLFIVMTSLGAQAETPIKFDDNGFTTIKKLNVQRSSPSESPRTLDPAMVDKIREMQKNSSFNGGDSGGGGGMALVAPGIVKLADLTASDENFVRSFQNMSSADQQKYLHKELYSLERGTVITPTIASFVDFQARHFGLSSYRDIIGVRSNFEKTFILSTQAISRYSRKYPILKALINARCNENTPVFLYQPKMNITVSPSDRQSFYSERFPVSLQQPLAYFYENALIVSAQLFSRMNEQNIIALGVHECLRHLNSNVLEVGLTTPEIEALTRAIMNLPFKFDAVLMGTIDRKLRTTSKNIRKNDQWVNSYINEFECNTIKEKAANEDRIYLSADENKICDGMYNTGAEEAARDFAPKNFLFCTLENPKSLNSWRSSDFEKLSSRDIRDVLQWFKNSIRQEGLSECYDHNPGQ